MFGRRFARSRLGVLLWDRRFVFVGGSLELANESLGRVLYVAHHVTDALRDARQLLGAEKDEGEGADDRHVGN